MSKATATLILDHTRSHYRSLQHGAAMQEVGEIGTEIAALGLAATTGPELTRARWLSLSRLSDRLEAMLAVREFDR
jgi:hypothetical protein